MKRLGCWALTVVLLLVLGVAASSFWLYWEMTTPYCTVTGGEAFIEIPRGAGSREIARLLTKHGVLRHRIPFLLYLKHTRSDHRIKAGEYHFSQPATPREITDRLIRGDVFFRSITIPEGRTAAETIRLLSEKGFGESAEMERALARTEWIRDLAPEALSLEGFLFPETYRFARSADSETIIRVMTEQFREKMRQVLKSHAIPDAWDIPSIVTLASMIEKEVHDRKEAPLVASVLVNRLRIDMTLGCDATIIYALKIAGTYDGRLGKAHLSMESPYNTYINRGLPPGPICNPGMASIKAALRPESSPYLYYVSRNDGTHQFSRDYRTHLQAVYKYQQAPFRKR